MWNPRKLGTTIKELQQLIESDTWEFLESNTEKNIPNFHIEYRGHKIDIPLDLAESNGFIQQMLIDLSDLIIEDYT